MLALSTLGSADAVSVLVLWVLTALIICKIVKKITIIMIIIATIMIIITT